jgi:probable HAF family extracellular repeat protein
MKRSIGTAMLVIALTGLAMRAEAQTVSPPPHYPHHPHYAVTNLGTLGGSQSNGYGGVTNNGWVSGDSFLRGSPTYQTEHAFVWRDGVMTDLGTLGGLNSSTAWPQKNTHGLIVGQAQGKKADPLVENWSEAYACFTTGPCTGWQNVQLGFRWQNGMMTELPPIGGNNSSATGDNNLGQVVGWAETGAKDPICPTSPTNQPSKLQQLVINAVVWGPRGEVQQLLPLEGDDLSAAFGINDNGDVVGMSGTCGTPDTPALGVHAVLWRNGSVFDLGGLGGKMNNLANVINNAGWIVGQSDLTGDTATTGDCAGAPLTRAVLWRNGVIINLGVLPGDCLSSANDINARGQVIGLSCDVNFNCRAFLWDHGVMMDLNSLVPVNTPLYLYQGEGINDRGEITGSAFPKSNPAGSLAFLAIPAPAAEIAGDTAEKIVLPANIRASLQRRLRLGHFGVGPTAQQ